MLSPKETQGEGAPSGHEVQTPFGPLSPAAHSCLFPTARMQVAEWQWSQPFPAILAFCGFTIHDIVASRKAAAEARVLWKIWKAARALRERWARQAEIDELLWWRAMGCPVSCPTCSAGPETSCDCGRHLPGRCTGQLGLDSGGALG